MTDQDFRFCPRCGTGLVAGQPYCPKCGFNVAGIAGPSTASESDVPGITPRDVSRERNPYRDEPRRTGGTPIILAAIIIAAGLIGYGLLSRPNVASPSNPPAVDASGSPVSLAPGVTPPPSAPIVGLTIQSPRDGEQVFTKEVTVIGLAPPGMRITRDISLRPDQHATADSTGHWAIAVSLDQGENTLVFRIGDDRSTEQRLRITYAPPTT